MAAIGSKAGQDSLLVSYGFLNVGGEVINFFIMPRFGHNIERIFKNYESPIEAVVINIGIEIIEDLERIHDCGYTYNDLKP